MQPGPQLLGVACYAMLCKIHVPASAFPPSRLRGSDTHKSLTPHSPAHAAAPLSAAPYPSASLGGEPHPEKERPTPVTTGATNENARLEALPGPATRRTADTGVRQASPRAAGDADFLSGGRPGAGGGSEPPTRRGVGAVADDSARVHVAGCGFRGLRPGAGPAVRGRCVVRGFPTTVGVGVYSVLDGEQCVLVRTLGSARGCPGSTCISPVWLGRSRSQCFV